MGGIPFTKPEQSRFTRGTMKPQNVDLSTMASLSSVSYESLWDENSREWLFTGCAQWYILLAPDDFFFSFFPLDTRILL